WVPAAPAAAAPARARLPDARPAGAAGTVVSQPSQLPHPLDDRPADSEVPPAVEMEPVRCAQVLGHDPLLERPLGGGLFEQAQRRQRRAAEALLGGEQAAEVQEVCA